MTMAILCMLIGCIPAFHTAITTDSYLTLIDYASLILGFSVGGLILELDEARDNN